MEFLWGRLALYKSWVGICLWVTSYQDHALSLCPAADREQVPLTMDCSVCNSKSTPLIPSVNRGFRRASVTYSCQFTWVSVNLFFPRIHYWKTDKCIRFGCLVYQVCSSFFSGFIIIVNNLSNTELCNEVFLN